MDSQVYSKFCVDTKLYTYSNVKDADLVFFKAKKRGERRLTYEDFRLCLLGIAEDKGMSYSELVSQVLKTDGPNLRATKAEAVRFHDDKSLYTGAYGANIGRSAPVREVKNWREGRAAKPVPGLESVFKSFNSFAGGNAAAMTGEKWVKILRDSGLFDKYGKGTTEADLVFSKVKMPNARVLNYEDFLLAVECISETCFDAPYYDVAEMLLHCEGPKASGTRAEACRFYDEKDVAVRDRKSYGAK